MKMVLVATCIGRFKFLKQNRDVILIALRMSLQRNCHRKSNFGGTEKPKGDGFTVEELRKVFCPR